MLSAVSTVYCLRCYQCSLEESLLTAQLTFIVYLGVVGLARIKVISVAWKNPCLLILFQDSFARNDFSLAWKYPCLLMMYY